MEDLDCSAVLADVWLLLDNECDAAVKQRLREHIDRCSPCIEAYGLEEKLKSLLNRKCGGDRAPDSLRQRLTMEIRTSYSVVETKADSAE
ncbi:mycothiol system anti-sigma-R factor [Nocardia sp. CDC160]|uniref:mycothiol system anti-sigma-R factor n=1 Tax=Nocardia sp. CDC160 TaxID=3112166 RepID=UPI002DBF5925|nr:mycothiol system anti-sigma-R factor [Nocardia sp. CDC160]MEC3916524.1 mycothiol system anti-sigma-R factor [Nocardia sp. CDC160]